MKTLIPVGSRVLIEPIAEKDVTEGGILIPEIAKEKPQRGIVVAVGDGDYNVNGTRIPVDVKRGDIVLFAKYGGTEIKIDGHKLIILRASDLLAVEL